MDAAFRMGYLPFKSAAEFVPTRIRDALGVDAADAITNDPFAAIGEQRRVCLRPGPHEAATATAGTG
jgi:hypothetical protein